jgi:hypothetical protein
MEYVSTLTGHPSKPAVILAEIMCDREARKKGETLPDKFWNTDKWAKKFKQQMVAASRLLKVYEPIVILNTLKRRDCQWQYSLLAKGIADACEEEAVKIAKQNEKIVSSKTVETNKTDSFRPVKSGNASLRSKLD